MVGGGGNKRWSICFLICFVKTDHDTYDAQTCTWNYSTTTFTSSQTFWTSQAISEVGDVSENELTKRCHDHQWQRTGEIELTIRQLGNYFERENVYLNAWNNWRTNKNAKL